MSFFRGAMETGALFAALFLIMPYIPSHEGFVHSFGPKHGVAILVFGASRLLRWQKQWWIAIPETAAFGLFAWALVTSYTML